jgi:hypothetical protein
MKNKNILNIIVFLIIVFIFIVGCKVGQKETRETIEEVVDTGALVVESSPILAQVYIGEEYRGDTPLSLYNIPVGQYDITVKKEGFVDFKKTINIKVGRTEEIDATLTQIVKPEAEEKKPEEPTEKMPEIPAKLNKINLSSFAMYYDFDKMEFTELRTEGSDLFSRKYNTYVHFTALIPTKINVINKPINEIQKEDCIFGDTAVTPVFSGQTLCIKTGSGIILAIGGIWQTMPTEVELVIFN